MTEAQGGLFGSVVGAERYIRSEEEGEEEFISCLPEILLKLMTVWRERLWHMMGHYGKEKFVRIRDGLTSSVRSKLEGCWCVPLSYVC